MTSEAARKAWLTRKRGKGKQKGTRFKSGSTVHVSHRKIKHDLPPTMRSWRKIDGKWYGLWSQRKTLPEAQEEAKIASDHGKNPTEIIEDNGTHYIYRVNPPDPRFKNGRWQI